MTKRIQLIALVGLPGSGKTVAANFFRKHGFTVLRFGDQTDIGLKEQGLPRTEENEKTYREKIRKDLGMAAMAIKIEPRIREAMKKTDAIVLDGMRSLEEYTYLREKFPHLTTLCLYAPPALRYQRLSKRKVRPLTAEESKLRDVDEVTTLHSGGPIALSEHLIKNEGSPDDFLFDLKAYLVSRL